MREPADSALPPAQAPPAVVLAFHADRGGRGRRRLHAGPPPLAPTPGRVPRVARMMALAIHWQGLIRAGVARDQADLARLVSVHRARVTQVMDLLRLAPDLQEAVLDLPRTTKGRDRVRHRDLARIAAQPLWSEQRSAWTALRS